MSDKYPGGFVTANAPAGFSVAFGGASGTSLTIPNSSSLDQSGDFTQEVWYCRKGDGHGTVDIVFLKNLTNFVYLSVDQSSGLVTVNQHFVATLITGTTATKIGVWYHLAVCRSGNSIRMFVNGVQEGSTATYTTNTTGSAVSYIGAYASDHTINGYLSNLRVTNTALYTATFTPPTQLFPITNTQLLTCQSPTLVDNSANNFTITANGDAVVSNFTPFAAYQGFNPALGAAAGGVWTLDEAAYYQNNRQWPIYDPYFNQTTLMLHGNGTNAAQNNTFLDSSTNNFTITRNGNTTQGSFTPFSPSGFSTYFNGSSQGIVIPSSTFSGNWVNSNFTFETWVYVTGNGPNGFAWFYGQNNNDCLYLGLDITNRNIYYGSFNGISFNYSYATSNNIWQKDQWMHIAWVRDSTASNTGGMKIFLNGVMVGQGNTGTFGVFDNSFFFNNAYYPWADFNGYCAGLRLTNRAIYSSNFTPERLTNIAGTKVLLCTDKTITDASPNRYPLSITGTPSVQAFSPFVPAYITPTTYSNWFDGSGDYLTVPNNAAFDLGSGDATIEAWIYPTSSSQTCGIFDKRSSGANYSQFPQIALSSGAIVVLISYSGSSWAVTINGATPTVNAWSHIALVRNGNIWTLYVNGVVSGTPVTASGSVYSSTDSLSICASTSGGLNPFTGCISNARIVKGTAVYTASFTPPTAPLINITNTSLLTCQSSTFIDNSTNNFTITANGNTVPVTTPAPFNPKVDTTTLNTAYSTSLIGGSAYFDGSGDNLTWSGTAIGSGDYTVECWFYATAYATYTTIVGALAGGTNAFALYVNSATQVQVDHINVGPVNFTVSSMSLNSWNHLVVTRSSGNLTVFVNGVRSSTGVVSNSSNYSNTTLSIGYGSGATYFPGYISNLRIVTGTSVYNPNTTGFVPPSTPLTAVSGTQLLLNYTNGAIFDNTAKNVLETVGNAQISTAQSKWGSGSMYFDGTGDRVQISPNTSQNVVFGTGDFTIEMWLYPLSLPSGTTWSLFAGDTNSAYLYMASGGTLGFGTYNVNNLISGGIPSINTWSHITVTRSGSTLRLFLNGVQTTTAVTSSQNFSAASYVIGGDQVGGTISINGYIDDLRITKGVARYVTNFTPPTSQLQDQ